MAELLLTRLSFISRCECRKLIFFVGIKSTFSALRFHNLSSETIVIINESASLSFFFVLPRKKQIAFDFVSDELLQSFSQ